MARSEPPAGDAETFDLGSMEEYRAYLLRFAQMQLRDVTAAEDVVQETLLAAFQSGNRFAGRSSVRTWLTGILKHKIIDHLRRHFRDQPLEDTEGDADGARQDFAEEVFAENGHWYSFPAKWAAPDKSFENAQFWSVFETCIQGLPERAARVFVMREVMELSTDEICKELAITATNCWVMLHRARLSLRECLESSWFKT